MRSNRIFTYFSIFFLLLPTLLFAETCPSIKDIKHLTLGDWKFYDSDDDTPLSAARIKQFREISNEFALAEWPNENNTNNAIHCYYRDKNGANLEAYLANHHFQPNNTKKIWYPVTGYMHCAAGKDECTFERALDRKQLAKR